MQPLSHTRKVVFRLCRRKHHLQYDLGVRPIREAIQLRIGSALHLWLEGWFCGQLLNWDPPRWVSSVPPIWDPDEVNGILEMKIEEEFRRLEASDPFEVARLRAMVLSYHLRWCKQDLRVHDVETKFRAPLIDPDTGEASTEWERDGRMDVIVEVPRGVDAGIWVLEHKSHLGPLDPGDAYFTALRANPQVSDYFIGAEDAGHAPRGILYDVVCKPNIRPLDATPEDKRKYTKGEGCIVCGGTVGDGKKGKKRQGRGFHQMWSPETQEMHDEPCPHCNGTGWKDPPRIYANQREHDETPGEYGLRCFQAMLAEPERYLHRVTVVRFEHELEEHMRDDWQTAADITAESKREHHPRNPDACYAFNRPCDMFPVCWNGASIHDGSLYRISRRPDPKPEMQSDEEI